MRHVISGYLFAVLLSSAVIAAQDRTITTNTTVKSDNGKVVTMTGCVQIGGGTSFVLTNITSEQEQHDKKTSSGGGTYALIEREGLDLGPYIHQRVELTGVVVPAATHGDKDDKIKIRETTKVAVENGPDKTSSAATTVKVARGGGTQFLVASVKTLAPSCQQ
jgi:hypothetical protein